MKLCGSIVFQSILINFKLSGTPLHVARRLQFSLDMEPIQEYAILKDLPKAIIPMFWLEERLSMNQTFIDEVNTLVL